MEEALSYCFSFVREGSVTWKKLAAMPDLRARFQKQLFPEKVAFDGKKFGTKKMSLVYELNQTDANKTSDLVTSRRGFPNCRSME